MRQHSFFAAIASGIYSPSGRKTDQNAPLTPPVQQAAVEAMYEYPRFNQYLRQLEKLDPTEEY